MSNPLLDTSALPRFAEIAPEHAVPALQKLIAEHRRKLATLLDESDAHDVQSLVTPLQDMSHELSRVWSPIGHLQSVLDEPGWRQAYNESLPLLTEHATEISQNQALQQAYQYVAESLPEDVSGGVKALIEHELRDFRLAGVALPTEQKDRFKELMRELAEIQARFQQNVQDSADAWHFHSDDESKFRGLPEQIKERARQDATANNVDGFWLNLDFPTYHAVLMQADDRELRKMFYTAWSTRASEVGEQEQWDNSDNIRRILTLRHEAAQLVGFDNYAEYSLATKMAAGTEEVTSFLRELASRTRATADRELESIQAFAPHALEAWDIAYYQEKLKQQKFSVSDDELRQYFPTATVRNGLFELARKLYGVTLAENPSVQCWDDNVNFYDVADESGTVIGGFYTDLYARTGKRNGAWIDECIVRKNMYGENVLPVGYLVCNFSPPDRNGVALLTHNDVLTLFHEFGHMLHHLLTQIDYPSIAGINGVPWDAVELPSQFMENFAWCYEVLERASSHCSTGEPLPEEVFARLDRSRHFGAGLAMLRQIEFALFDFRLHSEFDPAAPVDALQVLDQVREEIAVLIHPEFNRMPHAFSHIFSGGYAAGYYSYKWAEVLAADAFSAFAEAGIFDQQTAARFRNEILEVGGSKDIMDAYVAFRGRKPTMDALLRYSGIAGDA
jgi:oligopeptidase A